jgi:hypothetical protein
MPDDHEDVLGVECLGRGQDVTEKGAAADLVEHLGGA